MKKELRRIVKNKQGRPIDVEYKMVTIADKNYQLEMKVKQLLRHNKQLQKEVMRLRNLVQNKERYQNWVPS